MDSNKQLMDQVPPEPVLDVPAADLVSDTSPFTVPEEDLASTLGLSRADLREVRRNTVRGEDWQVRGHRVCWSENAAYRLAMRQQPQNGIEPHPPLSDAVATPAASAAAPSKPFLAPPEVLRVTGWNFANARIIRCIAENNGHTGESITVRVKNARLFRSGMQVLARPQPGSAWEFVGNPARPESGVRYPRRPGVW
jgi:hypothetical protein